MSRTQRRAMMELAPRRLQYIPNRLSRAPNPNWSLLQLGRRNSPRRYIPAQANRFSSPPTHRNPYGPDEHCLGNGNDRIYSLPNRCRQYPLSHEVSHLYRKTPKNPLLKKPDLLSHHPDSASPLGQCQKTLNILDCRHTNLLQGSPGRLGLLPGPARTEALDPAPAGGEISGTGLGRAGVGDSGR